MYVFANISTKEITDMFNSWKVDNRLKFLDSLSVSDKRQFLKKIREQAVKDFWTHEQELIKSGRGTRSWTPEQIEEIMSISEKTGMASINGSAAHDVNNESFYGHHMLNVADHPEYAADWRNIQPLDYNEHRIGAHGGNTSNPTHGFYNIVTKETEAIDASMFETYSDVNNIDGGYIPTQKSIFKSDLEIQIIYKEYGEFTDGEMIALKNIELSMDSEGGLVDFNRGLEVAQRYNSAEFETKLGIMTNESIRHKYSYIKEMTTTDVEIFKAYEYFKSRGVDDNCIEKLGVKSDSDLLHKYKFMESSNEFLDFLRAYEYQNSKRGNTMPDIRTYFNSDSKMTEISCLDDSLSEKSIYEIPIKKFRKRTARR